MIWLFALFVALASCLPSSPVPASYQPLVQERGTKCSDSLCSDEVSINLTRDIEANVFDGTGYPTLTEIPLKTWSGSTPKRHLRYRAWRTTSSDRIFQVALEVQITGHSNLFVNFGATSDKGDGDPGLSRVDNGLARGSGASRYPTRSSFGMMLGTVHRNIDYTFKGKWSRNSP